MPPTVWLNGAFIDPADARLSVFDAGLQHGVGLFETMLAVRGGVVRAERHVERLRASAAELGLSDNLRARPLVDAVRQVAQRAALDRARIRLTLTGGDLNMLQQRPAGGAHDPTILIVAQQATEYPPALFDRGAAVTIADARVNPLDPFSAHKSLNYWPRLRALQLAGAKSAGETLFLQVSNHLAGGAVSNLFLAKSGALLTPVARGEEAPGAIPSPVLPGVTRGFIIETAAARDIPLERRLLTINDLLDADEAFLTNSSWGVLPVVRVEGKPIGAGDNPAPGPLARAMLEAWRASLEEAAEDASDAEPESA